MKRIAHTLVALFFIPLVACAPGQYTFDFGITMVSGTNPPPETEIITEDIPPTQTAFSPTATLFSMPATPVPTTLPVIGSTSQKTYQSAIMGIQFNYPDGWYLQEFFADQDTVVNLTSFDPANPPHKLEWTRETVSMQFHSLSYTTGYSTLEAWEGAKQMALGNTLSVFVEERFLIANQPAAHITLVSGSGGIINQVYTILNGRYYEIEIEAPDFSLAKTVLDTVQPL